MKTAIYAAWCHIASSKNNNFHDHCPEGPNSWCMYKVDDSLLMNCLHGKTQNQNESFNGMIWNRVPKSRFNKYKQFATAIFDATAHFNIGNLAALMIYDKLDIERGYYPTKGCIDDNCVRINNARRKSSDEYQGSRKFIRGEKKRKLVNHKKSRRKGLWTRNG